MSDDTFMTRETPTEGKQHMTMHYAAVLISEDEPDVDPVTIIENNQLDFEARLIDAVNVLCNELDGYQVDAIKTMDDIEDVRKELKRDGFILVTFTEQLVE
jgi:hypothetical protein